VEQFTGKTINHGLFIARTSGIDQPANSQSLTTLSANINRNLVSRTTNTARTHFKMRSDIVESLMEHANGLLLGLLLHAIQRTIYDAFSNRLTTGIHDGIHKLAKNHVSVLRIRVNLALFCTMTSGHILCLSRSWYGINAAP